MLEKYLSIKDDHKCNIGKIIIKVAVVALATHFIYCMHHNVGKILKGGKLIRQFLCIY